MFASSRWIRPLVLLVAVFALAACGGGGGSSDQTTTFTVQGKVSNGPLVGSTVQVLETNGGSALGSATTGADGSYRVEVSGAGPYRLRATGGKMNGVDYTGVLEALCASGAGCDVTPYTTVLLRLVDDHGFSVGDAASRLAVMSGLDGDPFLESVPAEVFDLDAARQAISGGDGLSAWVASVVSWAAGETTEAPPGISKPGPGPDPDPETYTVSGTAGAGGSISPASQAVNHGATATLTVTPEAGYSIDSVSGCAGSLDGNAYTTGAITGACTVEASFLLNAYTVSATAGAGGDISPASQAVNYGATATFTVTPEAGHSIDSVSGCGGILDGTIYTTAAITGACTVTTSFYLLPSVPQSLQATADDGEVLLQWTDVDGVDGYTIYHATEGGIQPANFGIWVSRHDGVTIENVTSPQTVGGLNNGTKYFFVVTATTGGRESGPSNEVSAVPQLASLGQIPDTGQTLCFDNSKIIPCPAPGEPFYGQDPQYSNNPISYTKKGYYNNPNRFTKLDAEGNVLTDTKSHQPHSFRGVHFITQDSTTGLMWTVSSSVFPRFVAEWSAAKTYCEELTLGGYADWRLPTESEFQSLVDKAFTNCIDLHWFPDGRNSSDWTIEEGGENNELGGRFTFPWGDFSLQEKSWPGAARCVRLGQVPLWSMVQDNVTGLTWDVKYNYDLIQNHAEPNDADNAYTWYDSLHPTHPGDLGEGKNTAAFVEALNTRALGGNNDWRMPTAHELVSLLDFSFPAVLSDNILIDYRYFPNTNETTGYWSSDSRADFPSEAWRVSYRTGAAAVSQKSLWSNLQARAMAVRGSLSEPDAALRFKDHGDGTVTDMATGLMWQKTPSAEAMTWEQALEYSGNLHLAEHYDWRLPNIKELFSIVDLSLHSPAMNTEYFDMPPPKASGESFVFWSATTNVRYPDRAITVRFSHGLMGERMAKNSAWYTRAVRLAKPE